MTSAPFDAASRILRAAHDPDVYLVDGRDFRMTDILWVDRGGGWELLQVDAYDSACGDPKELDAATREGRLRTPHGCVRDVDRTLIAIEPSWRVRWPQVFPLANGGGVYLRHPDESIESALRRAAAG